jgi:hypothetical protein
LNTHHLDRRAHFLTERLPNFADDAALTTEDVADWLGVSHQWLEIGRSKGYGPAFVKYGSTVRYLAGSVRHWLSERTRHRTAEYSRRRHSDQTRANMRAAYARRNEQAGPEAA